MPLQVLARLTVGPLSENCYLFGDPETRDAVCIDPGWEGNRIIAAIERLDLTVHAVLITHSHADHIMAAPDVKAATGAPVLAPDGEQELWSMAEDFCAFWGFPADQPPDPDRWISAGTSLVFGPIRLDVLDVRGHSPAAVAYAGTGIVFPGDALFAGGIGRTDLPGQDHATLVDRIQRNLLSLASDTQVCPGHGPDMTVGRERQSNPYLPGRA